MRKIAALVLIVLGIAVLLGRTRSIATVILGKSRTTTTSIPQNLSSIVIKAANGDVHVRTGNVPELRRTERWTFARPQVDLAQVNGVLTVSVRCSSGLFDRCSVDFVATVPSKASVAVTTTNGDVEVTGAAGSLVGVRTRNGDVDLANLRSADTNVTTSNGDIHALHMHGPMDLKTSNGDVDASLDDRASATIRTSNGDVHLSAPTGSYALDVHTSHGDVGEKGITDDSASPDRLSVHTSNGDVTITGSSQ